MSADNDSAAAALPAAAEKCCASCGVAEIDDIKLKPCPHCDLVEYCSDQCQQEHLQKHEAACKERAAELYDEILFKQPESSYLGDCPICFLPMPIDPNKYRINACCCKKICLGCIHANNLARRFKENRCPFCRKITPRTQEGKEKLLIERAKLNDPIALGHLGMIAYRRGDYESAFTYLSEATALGDAVSTFNLSVMYCDGEGVEEDRAKERALLEKAAIAGHIDARYNLGFIEERNGKFERAVKHWNISATLDHEMSTKALKHCYKEGNVSKEDFAAALRLYQDAFDRAVKHWIIAAKLGDGNSIQALKGCYKEGHISKEDFAAALRANQVAVDAMKSPQRQAAEVFFGYIH